MKQLTVVIHALDTDKSPWPFSWQVSINSKAPRLTAGTIIQHVQKVAAQEGCQLEKLGDLLLSQAEPEPQTVNEGSRFVLERGIMGKRRR